jgi:hypothetical protein
VVMAPSRLSVIMTVEVDSGGHPALDLPGGGFDAGSRSH